jgi:hypothetical protein
MTCREIQPRIVGHFLVFSSKKKNATVTAPSSEIHHCHAQASSGRLRCPPSSGHLTPSHHATPSSTPLAPPTATPHRFMCLQRPLIQNFPHPPPHGTQLHLPQKFLIVRPPCPNPRQPHLTNSLRSTLDPSPSFDIHQDARNLPYSGCLSSTR